EGSENGGMIEIRSASALPRDNVLFELGLFMGALGRNRTFVVHSRTTPPMMPSDLAGITPATFEERSNLEAALGPACTKIRRAIETQGMRVRPGDAIASESELHKMLADQKAMLTALFQRLIANPGAALGSAALANDLSF